jgi:hypothetical protein
MSGDLWLGFAARRSGPRGGSHASETHVNVTEAARDLFAPGDDLFSPGDDPSAHFQAREGQMRFQAHDGLTRRQAPEGDRGAAALAGMMMAAISGGVAGLLLRGDAFQAALLLVAAVSAGCVGWWARGV